MYCSPIAASTAESRTTTLRFDPPPDELTIDKAIYRLTFAPEKPGPIFLGVSCNEPVGHTAPPFLKGMIAARRRAARRRTLGRHHRNLQRVV